MLTKLKFAINEQKIIFVFFFWGDSEEKENCKAKLYQFHTKHFQCNKYYVQVGVGRVNVRQLLKAEPCILLHSHFIYGLKIKYSIHSIMHAKRN